MRPFAYVGISPATEKLGLSTQGLRYEAFRMAAGKNWLALLGPDKENLEIGTAENDDPKIFEGDFLSVIIETETHSFYEIVVNPAGAFASHLAAAALDGKVVVMKGDGISNLEAGGVPHEHGGVAAAHIAGERGALGVGNFNRAVDDDALSCRGLEDAADEVAARRDDDATGPAIHRLLQSGGIVGQPVPDGTAIPHAHLRGPGKGTAGYFFFSCFFFHEDGSTASVGGL